MAEREQDGRFGFGNQSARGHGRPPKCYDVSHELATMAREPESVDDQGNPITGARKAAEWLWRMVLRGEDSRPDGGPINIGTRERLEAMKLLVNRMEPDFKLTPEQLEEDEAQDLEAQMEGLTDEELRVLEKIGVRR